MPYKYYSKPKRDSVKKQQRSLDIIAEVRLLTPTDTQPTLDEAVRAKIPCACSPDALQTTPPQSLMAEMLVAMCRHPSAQ